ncbi:MAG TPA: hypothetical protein IAB55_03310 [Candidatus Merdivicinus faecavium]|nr:hypothetical protein [Candidatus Merdivicinus faecavium]
MWKTVGKALLAGIAAAVLGVIFAEAFAAVVNGLGTDTGRMLGMGAYLCIVIVTCTGVILGRMGKGK